MRKIGGINMNTVAQLQGRFTKAKKQRRYCSVFDSIKQSLNEVKLHKESKINLDTWEDFIQGLNKKNRLEWKLITYNIYWLYIVREIKKI